MRNPSMKEVEVCIVLAVIVLSVSACSGDDPLGPGQDASSATDEAGVKLDSGESAVDGGGIGDGGTDAGATPDATNLPTPDAGFSNPDAGTANPDAGGSLIVVAGQGHTCVYLPSVAVRCFGANLVGQIGVGSLESKVVAPTTLNNLSVTHVGIGSNHACGVLTTGSAKCWGWNDKGMIGDGTSIDRNTPTDVQSGKPFSKLGAGAYHSCGIHNDKTVSCWGSNERGQLGITPTGATDKREFPVESPMLSGIEELHGGLSFTCARNTSGEVLCFGYNSTGQLGDGTGGCVETYPGGPSTCQQRPEPVAVALGGTATQISTGNSHACAVLVNGTAKCWGWNGNGELGDGTDETRRLAPVQVVGLSNVSAIAAGSNHTCAIDSGNVYCWGSNTSGSLGRIGDGSNSPVQVNGISSAVQISAGGHTCAVTTTGGIFCWGSNRNGQLGSGSDQPQSSAAPIRVTGT